MTPPGQQAKTRLGLYTYVNTKRQAGFEQEKENIWLGTRDRLLVLPATGKEVSCKGQEISRIFNGGCGLWLMMIGQPFKPCPGINRSDPISRQD
jgi:hypothetical protein